MTAKAIRFERSSSTWLSTCEPMPSLSVVSGPSLNARTLRSSIRRVTPAVYWGTVVAT